MAKITKIDPKEWKKANVVQVDVRAKSNIEAIEALDDWAARHGFARVHQSFLRVVVRADGIPVFRGACYRVTDEESKSVQFSIDAIAKRAMKIRGVAHASRSAG